MLNKNNIAIGFLIGLIFPGIAWLISEVAFKTYLFTLNSKPGMPYLVAIAVNLFIIRYIFKKGNDQTGIGLIICTFIVMALVFLFKMGHA
ncbi:MAG: stationary phase survival protein SurE [Mucilaginibacter sp.]